MGTNQNWKSDFQFAFKKSSDLFSFLGWKDDCSLVEEKYPIFIPQKLALKIKKQGPNGTLAREFLPNNKEISEQGLIDPIGDKEHYKAPQLIHRYYSRALFTPTSVCPVHCRYCFRKNELNANDELFASDFDKTLDYLKRHPEINELIFTGGDPLTLSNEKIRTYLKAFSEIESIKDIRFHTRYPVILPSRLDADFLKLMKEFSLTFRTLSLAIHANHIDEFDVEADQKIKELSQTGIQLLSQTVLLKGVNNHLDTLTNLINHFIYLKVRPYYLHHPDQVRGGLHFYLGLEEGRLLYGQLRSKLPGWGVPHYVIDIPGGSGKVTAFNPETTQFSGQLIGISGEKIAVQEPDLTAF